MSSSTTASKTLGQAPASGATITRSGRRERVVASPRPPQRTASARTGRPPTVTEHKPPSLSPSRSATVPSSRLFSPMNWATKAFSGRSYSPSGVESCWITPSLKTAIRFDMVSASPWSWVT